MRLPCQLLLLLFYLLSCVLLFVTPLTVACQGFPRQEHCSGLPFPNPGDLPNPGIEPVFPVSPVLAGGFFITEPPGKPYTIVLNPFSAQGCGDNRTRQQGGKQPEEAENAQKQVV